MSELASESSTQRADDTEWATLDRRTVAVTAILLSGVATAAGVPTGIGIAAAAGLGTALLWVLPSAVLLIALGSVADHVRWRRTRYRVAPDRVELRSGLLVRTRRSLHRDRIRSVDLTADPLLRLFGLVQVRIGTGEQTGAGEGTVVLRPVRVPVAEQLRRELLDRTPERGPREGLLAELDPSWIRYAPLSFVAPVLGVALFGGVLQVSEWFGLQDDVIDRVIGAFRDVPLPLAIAVLAGIALVIGLVGSLALFVEMWWHFRLEREAGGTLRVRRGLLTTRSISVDERRLRGVELVEPLGTRLVGAARVDAVATGMAKQGDKDKTDHKTLLPAAPRAVAERVAAEVLREPVSPATAARHTALAGYARSALRGRCVDDSLASSLIGHPVAARGRRLRWALGTVLVVEAPLVLLGALLTDVLLYLALLSTVVLVPLAVLLAVDAYRGLGHGVSGDYLVARSGTVRRATVALQRDGIIGWTAKQSVFQRRAGLLTLTATTAAGAGGYSIHDVGQHEGLAFAESVVPSLLTPFLERMPADRPALINTSRPT